MNFQLLSDKNFLRKLTLASLGLMCLLMLWASKDFGNSGDELIHQLYGEKVLNYYLTMGKDQSSLHYENMYFYGGLFDMLCAIFYKTFSLDIYNTRHFISALFGFTGILFASLLAKSYKGWGAALLTAWFLFLSPRYFGESMNNPKDLPFAAGMITGSYFICRMLKKFPAISWKDALWVALSIGLTIGMRVGGILLIPFLIVAICLEYFFVWRKQQYALAGPEVRKLIVRVVLIGAGGYLLGVLLWPYALQAPLSNPFKALSEMSAFSINIRMLFDDRHMMSANVPWYYIPKWIFISSPVIILIGFVLSPLLLFRKSDNKSQLLYLFFITFFPWLYIVYKHSPLYDGWRHLVFIYPPLVILSALLFTDIIELVKNRIGKYAVVAVVVIGLLLPAKWGIANYPNQIVYFNEFVGGIDGAFGHYETDYYMNSVKEAVYRLAKEKDLYHIKDTVTIGTCCSNPVNYYISKINPKIKSIYVRYRERYNSDYDYGVFYSRFVDKNILQGGYFPPTNTIIAVKADHTTLTTVTQMDPERNAYKGFQAYEQKDYPKAVAYYQKALALDPKNETGYSYYGIALASIGRMDESINALNEGLKMNPEDLQLLQVLEQVYAAKGDNANAQRTHNRSMAIIAEQQEEAGEE